MEVTKTTTFSQGLFSPEECDSGNLSDKQAKLDFLNKAISVTCFALGESIDVSAPWFLKFLTPQKHTKTSLKQVGENPARTTHNLQDTN